MKSGRDAVSNKLAIRLHERHVGIEGDAGPRHQLSLKGIAVDVDQPRQNQQAAGVDPPPHGRSVRDPFPLNEDRLAVEATGSQRTPAGNNKPVRHPLKNLRGDSPSR